MKITKSFEIDEPGHTAVALGFFDGVHLGHRAVIQEVVNCRKDGLTPVVFTFTTAGCAPRRKQGAGLLQTTEQREQGLRELGVEQLIMPPFELFMGMTPEEFAVDILHTKLKARVVCCGQDFRFGKGAAASSEYLREVLEPLGTEVRITPPVILQGDVISSTRIRECIGSGEIELANQLLGSEFRITGKVLHGKKLGRTIGFPTANQAFPPELQLPKLGVYQSTVLIGGKRYRAVTNVGLRPTVEGTALPNAESYIIGFSGDLYGQEITVCFESFLRPERKFASVAELKNQIDHDAALVSERNHGQGC